MEIEFCGGCGKVLSDDEGPDCLTCEFTEPEVDIDAEYLDELDAEEIQNEYEW